MGFEEIEGFVGCAQESRAAFREQQDAVEQGKHFGRRLVNRKNHDFAFGSQIPQHLYRTNPFPSAQSLIIVAIDFWTKHWTNLIEKNRVLTNFDPKKPIFDQFWPKKPNFDVKNPKFGLILTQ